ncbi:MAG: bifunctional demethylmenaquinone methyltransferase/2-methoxy-6-polyprenyl-1,4-benzoquinol methylase UbiE [Bacteroidales bacterium]
MGEQLKGSSREKVESMFDSIAWRYDFLNHFLSFGVDKLWRRRAIRTIASTHSPEMILDVATGTGDLAMAALRLKPKKIYGIDISSGMLGIGREKISSRKLDDMIELIQADSENIPFSDNTFDVAMAAFGVRNFSDPVKGLTEICRVLRPGGLIMVLEFSKPTSFPFRQLYNFYFLNILPFFGRLFSKDKGAYSYLPESVMKFPDNEKFIELLSLSGFTEGKQKRLSGGIASIYTGIKPTRQ